MTVSSNTPLSIDAVPAAPEPLPPVKETVGVPVYSPQLDIVTDVTAPEAIFAVPAAPEPPPPEKDTVGAEVYLLGFCRF